MSKMVLALDTSTREAGLCLLDAGKEIFSAKFPIARNANSKIFAPLQECLKIHSEIKKTMLLVVGTGPGSYTGIRVGISALLGIKMALNLKLLGLSSHIAYDTEDENYIALGDARRGFFYALRVTGRKILSEPELIPYNNLSEFLSEKHEERFFTLESHVAELQTQKIYLTSINVKILAKAVLSLSEENLEIQTSRFVEPFYISPPC